MVEVDVQQRWADLVEAVRELFFQRIHRDLLEGHDIRQQRAILKLSVKCPNSESWASRQFSLPELEARSIQELAEAVYRAYESVCSEATEHLGVIPARW